jgi:hypothetical protein
MSESRDGERIYSDKEASELLRRAAELQDSVAEGGMPRTGLTRAQVEQIAAEVGIEARFVREAMAEASAQRPNAASESRLFGGPLALESTRIVPGEATEAQWEAIVREVRRIIGDSGRRDRLGRAWEWTSPERELEETRVSVRPGEGQTEIEIVQRHDGAAFLYYMTTGMLSLIAALGLVSAMQASPVVEATVAGGGLVGAAALLRAQFGRWTRRKGQRQQELIERLVAAMQEVEASLESTLRVAEGTAAPVTLQEPILKREYTQEQPSITLQSRQG